MLYCCNGTNGEKWRGNFAYYFIGLFIFDRIVNSISAQESDSSLVKMHLDEAIKYLQAGNKDAAAIHLDNGHRDISSVSTDAQELFEAGMKSLSIGDSSGVLLHLNAADEKLS